MYTHKHTHTHSLPGKLGGFKGLHSLFLWTLGSDAQHAVRISACVRIHTSKLILSFIFMRLVLETFQQITAASHSFQENQTPSFLQLLISSQAKAVICQRNKRKETAQGVL